MDVGDQPIGEEQGQVGDVLRPAADVAHADGGDRGRAVGEDEVEDREVVDSQIPEHVDVVLEAGPG